MWQDIFGHDDIAEHFRQSIRRGRLASTYLFVGPDGIGKKRFALALAKTLLCQQSDLVALEPCGRCDSCRLFNAGNHPDLDVVGLPSDRSSLPLELFIGTKDHRNQEGVCHRIALRPFLGGRKVAIIDDADYFNDTSANCLLKTLEEPPPRSLMILIGTSPSKQLPTIRSRSQVVRFQPLAAETLASLLMSTGIASDAAEAARLAAHGRGSLSRAKILADPAMGQFRAELLHSLSSGRPHPIRLAKAMQPFVDDAGKESAERRERLRTVLSFAVELYRGLLRSEVAGPVEGDDLLRAALQKAQQNLHVRTSLAALEACLEAMEHVDRNANLGLVIQRWCEKIAQNSSAVMSR